MDSSVSGDQGATDAQQSQGQGLSLAQTETEEMSEERAKELIAERFGEQQAE